MTLAEAVQALMGHSNRDEVVALLEKDAGPVAQAIFQKGHNVGYAKKHESLSDLTMKVEDLSKQVTERDKAIADLRAKAPDAATLTAQFQDEIKTLQTKHTALLSEREQKIAALARSTVVKELKAQLLGHGVDPVFAEVFVEKPDVASRITVDANGAVQVLQPGITVPYASSTPEAGVTLLAADLVKTVDPKWLTSKADRGAGGVGGNGTTAPATGDAAYFDQIRQKTREQFDAKKQQTEASQKALAALGVSTTP